MPVIDLHTHTTASDGALGAGELLCLAAEREVAILAITDHDTLAGYQAALAFQARPDTATAPLQLIPGVEISSQWQRQGIHILGLNIDPDDEQLKVLLASQQQRRAARSEEIVQRLNKCGIAITLTAVSERFGAPEQLCRPHFAEWLVSNGVVSDTSRAYKRYLGDGKPAAVALAWAEMAEVVKVIRGAGGDAVLAHPAKYKLTGTKRRRLVADFAAAGGTALELISGAQPPGLANELAQLAQRHGLKGSCGSDFHRPDVPWQALGEIGAMPPEVPAVWESWQLAL